MRQIANRQRIYCGIDTHADTHHAAVITDTGILLEHRQFDTTATGYDDLTLWIRELGEPIAVGIEGTSSYGAGIARHLRHLKITVVEVPRPNRKLRRSAARAIPSTPKPQLGQSWHAINSPNPNTATVPSKRSAHCVSPDPALSKLRPHR